MEFRYARHHIVAHMLLAASHNNAGLGGCVAVVVLHTIAHIAKYTIKWHAVFVWKNSLYFPTNLRVSPRSRQR